MDIFYNSRPRIINPALCELYGLNEGIVLQQIHFLLQHAKTEKNGHVWVYNTLGQWQSEHFPWWSEATIKRILTKLHAEGLIIVEKLGSGYDRTNYYRINYDAMRQTNSPHASGQSDQMSSGQSDQMSSGQSDQMDEVNLTKCTIYREDSKKTTERKEGRVRQKRFKPPSAEQVSDYCAEKKLCVDAGQFVDYYTANGWKVGKASMKCWKAAVRNWHRRDAGKSFGVSSQDKHKAAAKNQKWEIPY